jgi:hypothetical protein
MRAKIAGAMIGFAMMGFGYPARGQFAYPPIVVVPPPTQNYAAQKPEVKTPSANRQKASADPPLSPSYHGRELDRF